MAARKGGGVVSGPIKPGEIASKKQGAVPQKVFDAFNELIVENFANGRAEVEQADVEALILTKLPDATSDQIHKKGWLDIEDVYRAAGWHVEYDKPGYNENYEPYFTFLRKQ